MLEQMIQEKDLDDRVEMFSTPCKGSLCMDGCSQGVCMRVDEKVFRGITPESVGTFFENEILPII
jgi:NADH:ubiquinone oxidoreductase subunit E